MRSWTHSVAATLKSPPWSSEQNGLIVSPTAAAFLIPVGPDVDEQTSSRVQLASEWELQLEPNRGERRGHRRHQAHELQWLRLAWLSGHAVKIVDLSAGGALLDSPVPLRPDSILTLDLEGRGFDKAIPFRVVRCQIGALLPGRRVYRGACEFTIPIELPTEQSGAPVLYSGAFVSLDLALKQLVERTGAVRAEPGRAPRTFDSLSVDMVRDELSSLRDRALKTPLDPMGGPLAALLATVVPALELYRGLHGVIVGLERELRRTVPQVSLRLVGLNEPPGPGKKSILINVPGATAGSALVSIDLPRGVVLNDWQTRVLRVTSRLIALLQRLEPDATSPMFVRERADAASPRVGSERSEALSSQANHPSAWQKIVVRYAEGQILKGYTHDFSPARQQFSLWPSLNATPTERVIVPLARLKGVFFVRDFNGNPGYIEQVESGETQHGRRIEVTLVDDEVIVGRTLSYRPDGHGFFVIPSDPLANNLRIFVVSSSVRQVRFP